MKSPRTELILLVVLLVGAMAAYVWMQGRATKARGSKPEVAIQEGKTIDFSSGRPVVQDDAKQKSAIEKSVKEMAAAAANVTFPPAKPAEKKAEPTAAATAAAATAKP